MMMLHDVLKDNRDTIPTTITCAALYYLSFVKIKIKITNLNYFKVQVVHNVFSFILSPHDTCLMFK